MKNLFTLLLCLVSLVTFSQSSKDIIKMDSINHILMVKQNRIDQSDVAIRGCIKRIKSLEESLTILNRTKRKSVQQQQKITKTNILLTSEAHIIGHEALVIEILEKQIGDILCSDEYDWLRNITDEITRKELEIKREEQYKEIDRRVKQAELDKKAWQEKERRKIREEEKQKAQYLKSGRMHCL